MSLQMGSVARWSVRVRDPERQRRRLAIVGGETFRVIRDRTSRQTGPHRDLTHSPREVFDEPPEDLREQADSANSVLSCCGNLTGIPPPPED